MFTGDIGWLERTGGKLAWYERMRFLGQGIMAKAARKSTVKDDAKKRSLTFEDIIPPDSAITREAISFCQDVSEPYLFNHCMRGYFWSRILDKSPEKFDDEALFVAFLFHDLGLTDSLQLSSKAQHCFTYVGAKHAQALALKHRWSEKRAELTANAIALHLNVVIPKEAGKEAFLLRLGSGADVAGLGIKKVPEEDFQRILEVYPRHQLKKNIAPVLTREANRHSCCRIAFLQNQLGFGSLVQNAPFAE